MIDSASESKWVKADEIAKRINVSVSFLWKNRNNPDKGRIIPYARLGRKVMYNVDEVDEFLKKNLNGVYLDGDSKQ